MSDDRTKGQSPNHIVALQEPRHAGIASLHRLWLSKRQGDLLPARSDLDPADFKSLLPNILLIDLLPPPDYYRIRVSGETVNQFYGRSVMGLTPREYLSPEGAAILIAVQQRLLEARKPLFRAGSAYWLPEKGYKQFEMGVFPLASDRQRIDMALSALTFSN